MASGAAMKTSLVLMLLLGAVVAAHGHKVMCTNACPSGRTIKVNGIEIAAGLSVWVDIKGLVKLTVKDKLGVLLQLGSFQCPQDVKALIFVYESGFLKVKVAAVGLVKGLLQTVLGLVLGKYKCSL